MRLHKVLIATLLVTLGASAAWAQDTTPTATTPEALTKQLHDAETSSNASALIYLYGEAATQPQLAQAALSQLMGDYYTLRGQAQSAEQASQAVNEAILRFAVLQAAQNAVTVQQNQTLVAQNQTLIQQNQRIIALLDQIAKRK